MDSSRDQGNADTCGLDCAGSRRQSLRPAYPRVNTARLRFARDPRPSRWACACRSGAARAAVARDK